MTLAYLVATVSFFHALAENLTGIGAESHRAAHFYAVLIGHEIDDGMFSFGTEFGRIRVGITEDVAGKFDDRDLHAETDPEIRYVIFARILARSDLPLYAAAAETAGDQHAVHAAEIFRNVRVV